jgi:hypothetical protein
VGATVGFCTLEWQHVSVLSWILREVPCAKRRLLHHMADDLVGIVHGYLVPLTYEDALLDRDWQELSAWEQRQEEQQTMVI